MSKKTKLTDKEKEIIKKVTDYIQYVPDEQKIYILGVVDTVGMLCRDEKAGQEVDDERTCSVSNDVLDNSGYMLCGDLYNFQKKINRIHRIRR